MVLLGAGGLVAVAILVMLLWGIRRDGDGGD
jgi:hypothetical protein